MDTEPRVCGPCQRGQHHICEGPNEFWGPCTCTHECSCGHHASVYPPAEETGGLLGFPTLP